MGLFLITCVNWLSEITNLPQNILKYVVKLVSKNPFVQVTFSSDFCFTNWKVFQSYFLQALLLSSSPTHVYHLRGVRAPRLCCKQASTC